MKCVNCNKETTSPYCKYCGAKQEKVINLTLPIIIIMVLIFSICFIKRPCNETSTLPKFENISTAS